MKIPPLNRAIKIRRRIQMAEDAGVNVRTIDYWSRTDPKFPPWIIVGNRSKGTNETDWFEFLNSKIQAK